MRRRPPRESCAGADQSGEPTTAFAGDARSDDETLPLIHAPNTGGVAGTHARPAGLTRLTLSGRDAPGYRIMRRIGRGGMASVYLARREEDDQEITLKAVFLKSDDSAGQLRRFMREYTALERLSHRHVIGVFERAFASDFAYIAMEYFPAGDLAARLRDAIEPREALSYTRQLALGLGAAHRAGIVHRDVKPGNVLFRDDGSLALCDFGIARVPRLGFIPKSTENSHGTPRYMSPEQFMDHDGDERSDLYSLGVVLFQMLTGTSPFVSGSLTGLAHAHVHEAIPRLPPSLSHLQPLLDGLLAKSPDDRFQRAEELVEALADL